MISIADHVRQKTLVITTTIVFITTTIVFITSTIVCLAVSMSLVTSIINNNVY